MSGLKLFLSYHSSDKKIAGEIKTSLKEYGLDVFLAHEDIEPAEEWQSRILSELKKTDIFLPLLTGKFTTSKWTAQECGVAVASGTFIVSLKVDIDPFGFLSRYQAFNFRTENIARSCAGIARVIHKNTSFRKRFLDGLIHSFSRSDTFEEAKERATLLNDFAGYNSRQVNDVFRAAVDNSQIRRSFGARRQLDIFLKRNSGKADEALLRSYEKTRS